MARNALIQVRRGTAAEWTAGNPTLAVGEIGFETDTGKFKIGTGSTAWTSLLYVTDASDITGTTLASNVVSSALIPVGVINPYAGSTAPTGWLLCSNQPVSRETYSALFAVIGTTYGSGDGSTTFNVPDLRGRTVAGLDNMGGTAASRLTSTVLTASNTLGATGGTQTHVLAAGELPSHTHPAAYAGYSNSVGLSADNLVLGGGLYLNDASAMTARTGQANSPNGGAHLNTQPTIVLNYIIKAL